jgi:hypothetical protein
MITLTEGTNYYIYYLPQDYIVATYTGAAKVGDKGAIAYIFTVTQGSDEVSEGEEFRVYPEMGMRGVIPVNC